MTQNDPRTIRLGQRHIRSYAVLPTAAALLANALPTCAIAQAPPDFSGVYTLYLEPGQDPMSGFMMPNAVLPLTGEGQKRVDEYKKLLGPEVANPGAYCVKYGMPAVMETAGPYPIEFIQRPDQLTIIYEVEGETRRVYFGNRQLKPEDRIPSRDGYSNGHWEGDTLVVETDSLTDGIDQLIHPHSDQATITERFKRTQDKQGKAIIEWSMTMVDPVFYTRPVTASRKWTPLTDGHIIDYDCTAEAWLKLLDARRAQLRAGKAVTATLKDVVE